MAKIFFGFGNKKKNPFEKMTEEELKKIMRLFEEVRKDLSRKVKATTDWFRMLSC